MEHKPLSPADEHAGIIWWNSLSEQDRRFWCQAAGSAAPVDAWTFREQAVSESRCEGV